MFVCFASFGWNGLMLSMLVTLVAHACPGFCSAAATWDLQVQR